jgi:hypothetical protein
MTPNRIRKIICAVTAGFMLSATAVAEDTAKVEKPPPLRGNDCFFTHMLYDWQELDPNNLVVWASGRRKAYHVYIMIPLYDLKFSERLAFVDKDHDGMLCGFSSDEIAVTDRSYPQHSSITAMKLLDDEGIAKLEEQFKTRLTGHPKKKKPDVPEGEVAK